MRTSDAKAPVFLVPTHTADVLDISDPNGDLAVLEKVQFARVVTFRAKIIIAISAIERPYFITKIIFAFIAKPPTM